MATPERLRDTYDPPPAEPIDPGEVLTDDEQARYWQSDAPRAVAWRMRRGSR